MAITYHVIKFVNSKSEFKYAVVPESWVTVRRPTDNIAVIVYPTEDASTEERVMNNETPAADWKRQLCEILSSTNDYNEAILSIMVHYADRLEPALINKVVKAEKRKSVTTDLTEEASKIKKSSDSPKVQNKMDYYIVKFLSEDSSEHVVVPKSWLKVHHEDKTGVVVYPDALSEERVRNDETPADDWKQHLCEIVDTSNSYSDAKRAAMQKNNAEMKKTSIKDNAESTVVTENVTRKRRRNVENTAHESNTQGTQTATKEATEHNHEKVFTQMRNFLRGLIDDSTLMLNCVNECTNVNTSVLNDNTSVKTDSYTKWMLMHQSPGPELIEIIEDSKIYVDKNQLGRYTDVARSPTNLIRTVLTLIFKKIALQKCTLSGKDFKLDTQAVKALFDYVKLVGSKKGWSDVKEKDFNDCIRNKLAQVKRSSIP